MKFSKFIEQDLLQELVPVGKDQSVDGDILIAYKEYVFLLDEDNFEELLPKIQKHLEIDDEYYDASSLMTRIAEERPDVLTGEINGGTLYMYPHNFRHQSNSPYLKKVAKLLNLHSVEVQAYNEVSGDESVFTEPIGEEHYYHGTTFKALVKMKVAGLSPQFNSNFENIVHEDKVFVTNNFEKAIFHAVNASNKQEDLPIVIEVKIPDKNRLVLDYDVALQMYDDDTLNDLSYDEVLNNSGGRKDIHSIQSIIKQTQKYKRDISKQIGVYGYKGRIPFKFFEKIIMDEDALRQYVIAEEYGMDFFEQFELENLSDPGKWSEMTLKDIKQVVEDVREEIEQEREEDEEDY